MSEAKKRRIVADDEEDTAEPMEEEVAPVVAETGVSRSSSG